jgi:hypothetical protein
VLGLVHGVVDGFPCLPGCIALSIIQHDLRVDCLIGVGVLVGDDLAALAHWEERVRDALEGAANQSRVPIHVLHGLRELQHDVKLYSPQYTNTLMDVTRCPQKIRNDS